MVFDGLTVNEHHQTPLAMTPSPNLLAASLAILAARYRRAGTE